MVKALFSGKERGKTCIKHVIYMILNSGITYDLPISIYHTLWVIFLVQNHVYEYKYVNYERVLYDVQYVYRPTDIYVTLTIYCNLIVLLTFWLLKCKWCGNRNTDYPKKTAQFTEIQIYGICWVWFVDTGMLDTSNVSTEKQEVETVESVCALRDSIRGDSLRTRPGLLLKKSWGLLHYGKQVHLL